MESLNASFLSYILIVLQECVMTAKMNITSNQQLVNQLVQMTFNAIAHSPPLTF